jgi:heme exporter protein CcmD
VASGGCLTMDMQEFFRMGGYAGYVWTAYGLTAFVLLLNWLSARRRESEEQENARRRSRAD